MANVTCKINSKFDSKGTNDAKQSLVNLGSAAQTVNNVVKGFVGLHVFKQLRQAVGDCTRAYDENLAKITEQTGQFTLYQQKINDFKTATDSIRLSLGEVFGNIKAEVFAKIQPHLNNIATWFSENKDNIVGFFLSLPEIAKRTFQLIKDMLSFTFSMDFWGNYGKNIGNILVTAFKGVFETLWSVIKAIGTTLWEPIKTGFLIVGDAIQNTWTGITNFLKTLVAGVANGFIDAINTVLKALGDFSKKHPILGAAFKGLQDFNSFKNIKPDLQERKEETHSVDGDKIFDAWKNVASTFTQSIDDVVSSAKENGPRLAEAFAPFMSEFNSDVADIIKSNGRVASANRSVVSATTELAEETEENTDAIKENIKSFQDYVKEFKDNLMNSSGDANDIAKGFAEGGVVGVIFTVLNQLLSAFMSIENVSKSLNFLSTIFGRMVEVLEPIVNELFAPFVVILESLGELIGTILAPVFEVLIALLHPILNLVITLLDTIKPIISVFGTLVSTLMQLNPILTIIDIAFNLLATAIAAFYNYVIVPIVNFILKIVSTIVNAVAGAINFIIGLLNKIPGVNIRKVSGMDYESVKLKEIDPTTTATRDYTQTSDDGGSSSGTGSYSAAKDVTVNIYFNSSYVNGDAREIALALERELESAHALGY